MKIEKDATWLQLEGKVGQLRGDLLEAERKLDAHAELQVAKQLGLVVGETIVVYQGHRHLVSRVRGDDWSCWVYGRKIRKDGKPSEAERCLYNDWHKA